MQDEPYIVVIGHNLLVLQNRANMYARDQGYKPTGGPFWDEQYGEWCQAMYRAPEPDIECEQETPSFQFVDNDKIERSIRQNVEAENARLRAERDEARAECERLRESGGMDKPGDALTEVWLRHRNPDQNDIGRKAP